MLHHVKRQGEWTSQEVVVRYGDGTAWSWASVDHAVLSPNGERLLLIEEDGRFAVVDFHSKPPTAKAGWLPFLLLFTQLDTEFALQQMVSDMQPLFIDGELFKGLELNSATWLDGGDRIALAYEDGRVVEFDTNKMALVRTIRKSEWTWQHDDQLRERVGQLLNRADSPATRHRRVCRELVRSPSVSICPDPERGHFAKLIFQTKTRAVVHLNRQLEIYNLGSGERVAKRSALCVLPVAPEKVLAIRSRSTLSPTSYRSKDRIQLIDVEDGDVSEAWILPVSESMYAAKFPICGSTMSSGQIRVLYAGDRIIAITLGSSGRVSVQEVTKRQDRLAFGRNSIDLAKDGSTVHALELPRSAKKLQPNVLEWSIPVASVDRGLGGDQFRGSAGTGGWVAVRVGRGSNS
ncbi:MAG: hypothetical protein ABGX22_24810 [Pirellulaceae bacterium]